MSDAGNVSQQSESAVAAALRAKVKHAIGLHQQGKIADAERVYSEVLQQQPNHFDALHLLGVIAAQTQRSEHAIELIQKAIALNANVAAAHNNLGNALRNLRRFEDALASYEKAIALTPDYPEAYNNRGLALIALSRPQDASASFGRAIALKPEYAEAYGNQALCLLLLGWFEQGWRQLEWRKKPPMLVAARSYSQPSWLGEEDIAGKTLFLWWEQGLGDTIQFCRYAKLAEARGAKVVMSVQHPLTNLMKQLSPTIEIIGPDDVPTEFDYHAPLMSLPYSFRTTLEAVPAERPYLKVSDQQRQAWAARLPAKGKREDGKLKPRVGLVWSGGMGPNHAGFWWVNSRRNISLAKLSVLKGLDVEFYSLQKGQPAEAELPELIRQRWDGPEIADFAGQIKDFSDTAALIENLDLVISVDTSTAHLAGALGKPVWILNRFDTCWRWLLERTDSPWYPTVKLYRQQKAGEWDDVIQRVRNDLMHFRSGAAC